MALADELPSAEEELAAAIREGHLEESPEDRTQVRITNSGLARYLILQPAAEAMLQSDEGLPLDPTQGPTEVDETPPPLEEPPPIEEPPI